MQPDYFAILRTLYEFRIAKQVGAKANSLLMALIWKANVLRFPNSLTIWNSEVRDLAGLSEEELVTARNRLSQAKINDQYVIRYQTGGTKAPGRYQLNYQGLCNFFNNITPDITPKNTVNVPDNVGGNPLGNVGGNEKTGEASNIDNSKDDQNPSILTNYTKQTNTRPKSEKKVFEKDSLEYELSEYLLKKIKFNFPTHKEPDLNSWAECMDLIIRRDKRNPKEVKAVIEFAQDDDFWKTNILSVNKLRKQFDQLNAKRSSKQPAKSTGLLPCEKDL